MTTRSQQAWRDFLRGMLVTAALTWTVLAYI